MKESSLLRKLGVFLAIIICSYLVLSIFMDSNGEIYLLGYSFNLEGWSFCIIVVGWLYIIAKEVIKNLFVAVKRKKQ